MIELRDELRELRRELNKQIKLLDKEAKKTKRTVQVEPVAESNTSVIVTGSENNVATRKLETKINLLRKVVNNLQG